MSWRDKEIRSFHSLNIPIDAVYFDGGKDGFLKIPVLGVAVYDEVTYSGDGHIVSDEQIISAEKGNLGYVVFSSDGFDFGVEESDNLLGYEIRGEKFDWTREIERHKKKLAERAERAARKSAGPVKDKL